MCSIIFHSILARGYTYSNISLFLEFLELFCSWSYGIKVFQYLRQITLLFNIFIDEEDGKFWVNED